MENKEFLEPGIVWNGKHFRSTDDEKYEESQKKCLVDQKKIKDNLERDDYLVSTFTIGCKVMSGGDFERQVLPKRNFAISSLEDIPKHINYMTNSFWEHPDLLEDGSNADDIPFEEKKWGIHTDVVISPLSEELEKEYIARSEDGSFETYRRVNKL